MYSYKIELIHIPDFVPLNKNDNTMLNVVIIDDEKKAMISLEWELKTVNYRLLYLGYLPKQQMPYPLYRAIVLTVFF